MFAAAKHASSAEIHWAVGPWNQGCSMLLAEAPCGQGTKLASESGDVAVLAVGAGLVAADHVVGE
jgi:hypothetical protein